MLVCTAQRASCSLASSRREKCLGGRTQQIQIAALRQAQCRQRARPAGHVGTPAGHSCTLPSACGMGAASIGRTALDVVTSLALQIRKENSCSSCTVLACSWHRKLRFCRYSRSDAAGHNDFVTERSDLKWGFDFLSCNAALHRARQAGAVLQGLPCSS